MVYVLPDPVCPYANTVTRDFRKKACTIGFTASRYIFIQTFYLLVVHAVVESVVEIKAVLVVILRHVHLVPSLAAYFSSLTVTCCPLFTSMISRSFLSISFLLRGRFLIATTILA